jgi:hypothetical protein
MQLFTIEADTEQVSSGSNTAPGLSPGGGQHFPHTVHANAEAVPHIRPCWLKSYPV